MRRTITGILAASVAAAALSAMPVRAEDARSRTGGEALSGETGDGDRVGSSGTRRRGDAGTGGAIDPDAPDHDGSRVMEEGQRPDAAADKEQGTGGGTGSAPNR
jgi:hypothetical protein